MEFNHLQKTDSEIYQIIRKEQKRQEENIELIASENIASLSVLETQGSILTNKYAEGYPNRRYYGGCEYVDEGEQLAIDRACQLFGAKYANVQPHSGSQANQAVFFAELSPGEKILGMSLSEGGHLTHGSPVNLSGKLFQIESYGLDLTTGYIDYEELRKKALSFRPKLIIAGASAYPRIIDFKKFKEIADECGALLLVDMAHIAGLVATELHPNPIDYADYVSSTTHKTLRGPRGGIVLTNSPEKAKKINSIVFPGMQGGPLEHVIAAKAVAFKQALDSSFVDYQKKVLDNAKCLGESLVSYGFDLVSGGTDNHLILVDLSNKNLTGKSLEKGLDQAGITLNKNSVPNDSQSPFVTSGVRIGTPAVTTRGMGRDEMKRIADWINQVCDILIAGGETPSEDALKKVKEEVKGMVENFPIYFS